jgi:3,4-dihydroxy-2-butanone 4-phosphate synthase
MMRVPELRVFAQKHKLVLTSIQDLKTYRSEKGV